MSTGRFARASLASAVVIAIGGGFILGRLAVNFAGRPGLEEIGASTKVLPDVGAEERQAAARSVERRHVHAPERETPLRVRRVIGDEEGPFGRVWDLALIGGSLVVLDWQPLSDGHQILILDSVTGEVVRTMGPRGQGPSDLLEPQSVQSVDDSASRFWINDYRNGRMTLYDLKAADDAVVESVRIDGSPYQAYWAADSLFMNGMFATELVRRYLRSGTVASIRQEIGAPLFANVAAKTSAHLNRSKMAVHPSGDRLALVFTFLDRIQIYDLTGKLLSDVSGEGGTAPDLTKEVGEWTPHFRDVRATENLVLALAYRDGIDGVAEPTVIIAYTWEGEPVEAWTLETPIVRFAFDAAERTIWGVQAQPYPAIVEFESFSRPFN